MTIPRRGAGGFLSTPSARRATPVRCIAPYGERFLSTPSARRATQRPCTSGSSMQFLSTPSARRATAESSAVSESVPISIHALREEGDATAVPAALAASVDFYPRPPRGGRLLGVKLWYDSRQFLSTPSARRATTAEQLALKAMQFLSTPSARRATAKTETKSLFSYKLYNILHEFRRALIYNGSKNYPNHAK